jgi:arsenite/tail-anchored protein-transporting ATPase
LATDPVLSGRASSEQNWIEMVGNEFAEHFAFIPWLEDEKIGYQQLVKLDVRG